MKVILNNKIRDVKEFTSLFEAPPTMYDDVWVDEKTNDFFHVTGPRALEEIVAVPIDWVRQFVEGKQVSEIEIEKLREWEIIE